VTVDDRLAFFVFLVADGALAGSIYALVALAFVVVYKASRMINFAVA
jgi:branched-chain amino acid transport system permease protein